MWSLQDFNTEINTQINVITQNLQTIEEDENEYWYLMGKLDVYLDLKKGINQKMVINMTEDAL